MKILVYGLNFAPEPVGVGRYTGEMAESLKHAGHEVRVVTALPYYPEWQVSSDYKPYAYVREQWRGMRVSRAPLWVPYRPGGRKRVLHLLTFAVSSIPLMVRALFWRPDVVWMAAPAFVCAPAALIASRLTGAKSWIHVQDFEIDIGFGMGLISGSRWKRLVFGCERWLLGRFDRVSTISKAMMARSLAKGVQPQRLRHVPNWADVKAIQPLQEPSSYRAQLGIPPGAVVALYSGTMGVKQAVDWAAEAAVALKDQPNLYFVLCGEGALREEAMAACGHLPNVRFLPLQPFVQLNQLLGLADIHLLPQRADAAEMVMPSKLTGMLASGRPVVVMAAPDSELAEVVGSCGVVVPHGSVAEFAEGIRQLAEAPAALRATLGRRAREFADKHLASEVVLSQLEAEMRALVNDRDSDTRPPVLQGDEEVSVSSR